MEEAWFKCKVLKGAFSDERGILYRSADGAEDGNWVPVDKVRGEIGQMGAVRVRMYEQNGMIWIILPTDYSDSIVAHPDDVERDLVEA